MKDFLLEMRGITKVFPGVKALDNVSFSVEKGEIHCLVGENGAGKSTLMKVLSGVYGYGTYDGDIILDGEIQHFKGTADSEKAGLAIINQELALIPELTVYENVFFGHEITTSKGTVDWNETIKQTKEILNTIGVDIDPNIKAGKLGVGQQQMVEIAKAISKKARLLILDEPTAALNEVDCDNLLDLLRRFRSNGMTCIMISHKLREVLAVADTITVLRDGKTICSIDAGTESFNEQTLIKNMVGRELGNIYPKRAESCVKDEVVLETRNWCAYDRQSKKQILNNINIKIKRGEIVGISGLIGAGRTELALSIFGNTYNYDLSGELLLEGKKVSIKNSKEAIKQGIAYVSEDRKGKGLVLINDIKTNISFANLSSIKHGISLDLNKEIAVANEYKDALSIKAPSVSSMVWNLSGGNQQKVSLAKWLYVAPKLMILDEPTRGIDVGAKHEIYTLMNSLLEKGMSILMISSELNEVLGMSDRIYVLSGGRISGEFSKEDATEEKIMTAATYN